MSCVDDARLQRETLSRIQWPLECGWEEPQSATSGRLIGRERHVADAPVERIIREATA